MATSERQVSLPPPGSKLGGWPRLRFTFGQHPDGGDPELLAECMQVGTIGPDDVQRGSEKPIPGQGQDNVRQGRTGVRR